MLQEIICSKFFLFRLDTFMKGWGVGGGGGGGG